jgi:predicted dehydrogenase
MRDCCPINIAVTGCGYWGTNYVRVFHELPGARLAGICDVQPERLNAVRERFPDSFVTTQLDEVLALDIVDAVVICTDATSHYEIGLRCLAAGKHVLIEKPLTTHLLHAEELTAIAAANHLVLMVGHTFIYNPAIRKVKEYIAEDTDQIYYLYAQRTNLGPIRRDVNALWDLATHDFAIFNYLLDSTPEWVSAVGSKVLRNGREDVGFITLGYPGGILGHIHVSWADPNKTREIVVVLGDKRIVFDDLNALEQVKVFEKGVRPITTEPPLGYGEYRLQIRDGDIISPKIAAREPLRDQCIHFLECIESGKQPLTGGQEAIDVLRILTTMDRSVALGGTRVEVKEYCDSASKAVASAA